MRACLQCTGHSAHLLTAVANYTVQTAGTRGMVWLKSIVPTQQIYMLLLFSIYSVISLEVITFFLPLASFYAALFAMVICNMQMFYRCVTGYVQFVLRFVIGRSRPRNALAHCLVSAVDSQEDFYLSTYVMVDRSLIFGIK